MDLLRSRCAGLSFFSPHGIAGVGLEGLREAIRTARATNDVFRLDQ